MDASNLDETHPLVDKHGPRDEMYAQWDAAWGGKRLPWTGEYPGCAECREFGWYVKMTPKGWESCNSSDPEATEDMNRLHFEAEWDVDKGRFVRSSPSERST